MSVDEYGYNWVLVACAGCGESQGYVDMAEGDSGEGMLCGRGCLQAGVRREVRAHGYRLVPPTRALQYGVIEAVEECACVRRRVMEYGPMRGPRGRDRRLVARFGDIGPGRVYPTCDRG